MQQKSERRGSYAAEFSPEADSGAPGPAAQLQPGEEISLRIDQTLTHDINAVMCYLAFEGIGLSRVRTEVSVSYLDHNLLYVDSKTPDDHIFLQTLARHYGIWLSRPGNGIMHSVHLARFGIPGKTSLGTDSHTPSGGAIGMLAIGGGGMDVAAAMAGLPLRMKMPKVVRVHLTGSLRPGVAAKDVILEMLRRYTVKGGLGRIYEYTGPGAAALEVPERATIANMGAELGATTSLFSLNRYTYSFLEAQGRGEDYRPLAADEGCSYDEEVILDLSALEPLMACPDQPDRVRPVGELEPKKVQQVFLGSCTNGSYSDIAKAALVLQGRRVHEDVSCVCAVATKQIYQQLMHDGYLDMLLDAGVRLTEISCGACCGIGQSPATNGISVRTSNRNFRGRSGNPTAQLYLSSPETAAATAVMGTFATAEQVMGRESGGPGPGTGARRLSGGRGDAAAPSAPGGGGAGGDCSGAQHSAAAHSGAAGGASALPGQPEGGGQHYHRRHHPGLSGVLLHALQHSMMSRYCYHNYDPDFAARARQYGKSILVGGENYGQGSSREHAAINPMFLGVKAVIAKSMARIHKNNLINHGVVPCCSRSRRTTAGWNWAMSWRLRTSPARFRPDRSQYTITPGVGALCARRTCLRMRSRWS